MERRTPLKRTAFQPRAPLPRPVSERVTILAERAQAAMAHVVPRAAVMGGRISCVQVPKTELLRSVLYRRAVASLPCARSVVGYSQHGHENEGKGKALKVDDRRAMPLCCTRPGIEGCHVAFDHYRLVPGGRQAHIELGRAMAAQTRRQLNTLGLWPAGIPQYPTDEAS